MNKQELLAAAEVMRRAGCGEVVEYIQKESVVTNQWRLVPDNLAFNWSRYLYRILDFLSPPCGQSWHNPAGLNATQVGVHEGWRLLLTSEIDGKDSTKDQEWWFTYQGAKWADGSNVATREPTTTFRTKSPLPVVKPTTKPTFQESVDKRCYMSGVEDGWRAGWNAAKEQNNK